MKTEQMIRRQARAAMKGNMSKLIAAMGFVALTFLTIEYIKYFVLHLTGNIDFQSGEAFDSRSVLYLGIISAYVVIVLFLSPLLNGFLKSAANTAQKKKCESTDLFYYFKGAGRFFKTVLYNLLLGMLYFAVSGALNLSGYMDVFFHSWYNQAPAWNVDSFLVVLAGVVTAFIRILVFMIFVHYPLMAKALNDDIGIKDGVFSMLAFSVKNFRHIFKLAFSFIGWFALCFFVVPAIYVIPYFSVASLTSAKWLFALDKRGGEK